MNALGRPASGALTPRCSMAGRAPRRSPADSVGPPAGPLNRRIVHDPPVRIRVRPPFSPSPPECASLLRRARVRMASGAQRLIHPDDRVLSPVPAAHPGGG
jgi:hypothetical protein